MSEEIGGYRVIDLTRKLDPKKEKRRLEIRKCFLKESEDYYTDIDITSHLGTHVEGPSHYSDKLKDISQLPVTAFIGRGVMLDLKTVKPRGLITITDLEKADQGLIREGDVAILKSRFHCEPFSNNPDDERPQLSGEVAEWFAGKKVKAIGFGDSIAIENRMEETKRVHELLLSRDITFIEVMENIDELSRDVFMIIFLPLPIVGLDSCPVRVIAIEGIFGFE